MVADTAAEYVAMFDEIGQSEGKVVWCKNKVSTKCSVIITYSNAHTHTRLTALCSGLPRWASTRKVKPIWILLKDETVSGSGISWATCQSARRSRQITMPAPHHSVFLQAGCPSCRQTNGVKALKALISKWQNISDMLNSPERFPIAAVAKIVSVLFQIFDQMY